jgi:hypothetical protein
VLVVRPQPGQAVTLGTKVRRPRPAGSPGHHHLLRARLAGLRARDADGVADALLQQHRQRGGGRHRALGAHAGLGQAQVQRVVAAARQLAVHGDQVLHAADLARQDDLRRRQAQFPARSAEPMAD